LENEVFLKKVTSKNLKISFDFTLIFAKEVVWNEGAY
jgi:hypothetical protein